MYACSCLCHVGKEQRVGSFLYFGDISRFYTHVYIPWYIIDSIQLLCSCIGLAGPPLSEVSRRYMVTWRRSNIFSFIPQMSGMNRNNDYEKTWAAFSENVPSSSAKSADVGHPVYLQITRALTLHPYPGGT